MANIYYLVPSGTTPDKTYSVVGYPVRNGHFYTCECPGYFHKGCCSHIEQARYATVSAGPVIENPLSTDPNHPIRISKALPKYSPFAELRALRRQKAQAQRQQRQQHEVMADAMGVDL